MADNNPKRFKIVRAESDMDEAQLRDEKISNVLDEQTKRDYKFTINPSDIPEQPMILIIPDSETDDYWRTMLESISILNGEFSAIVNEDAPKDSMQNDLKETLCKMADLMSNIVNSDSWKNNELSEVDKKDINESIRNLFIPDSL